MASGFRRVHGLSLVGNSYIENLHFEPVTQDPIPVRAGRVWFNTTEKLYKFSTLDDTGAVVVNAFASREETLASIEALNVRVTALEDSYVNKNGSVAFTGDVNAGGHKVVNVATPTADTDAATKAYVDSGISDVQAAVSALGNAFRTDIQQVRDSKLDNEATASDSEMLGGTSAAEFLKKTDTLDCGDL